ncbi:MAG TPA: hypothetical protein VJN96_12955 [Vicinamibacterales bacterium]|nr:hypothetical protein [Vicinamibacterales bacterium]
MQTSRKTGRRRKLRPEDQQHLDNVCELIRRSAAGGAPHIHVRAALHMAEIRRSALRGDIDFDEWRNEWRRNPDIPEDLRPAPLPA